MKQLLSSINSKTWQYISGYTDISGSLSFISCIKTVQSLFWCSLTGRYCSILTDEGVEFFPATITSTTSMWKLPPQHCLAFPKNFFRGSWESTVGKAHSKCDFAILSFGGKIKVIAVNFVIFLSLTLSNSFPFAYATLEYFQNLLQYVEAFTVNNPKWTQNVS